MLVGYSSTPVAEVRLPGGEANVSVVHLSVHIRDRLNSITEYNLTSTVQVNIDIPSLVTFVHDVQQLNSAVATTNTSIIGNPIAKLLASGDLSAVSQTIYSLSQQLNTFASSARSAAVTCKHMNKRVLFIAPCHLDGVPITTVAVSALDEPAGNTVRSKPSKRPSSLHVTERSDRQ